MPITSSIFIFLAGLAIASAVLVVLARNPVYSVLSLIVTFFAIAGHYFLLNSQFLAAVHIIVYAGAIMVLFLYVIMMLNLNTDTEPNKSFKVKVAATISGASLMLVLIASLRDAETLVMQSAPNEKMGLVAQLGKVLYNEYMLPFEISAALFLTGMVGAVMLGKREAH